MSVFKLLVKIGGDAGDLIKSMDGAVGHLKGAFGDMAKIAAGNLIADGISGVARGMVDFAKSAVRHLGEVEAINAQTAAAIRSTGAAAGVSAEHVAGLADSIERNTGVSGEMIQAGQNLLLTFTNIRNGAGKGNDIFNQTTQSMADLSVRMGGDAKGAALQLGKALNDPINGVSALTRVGVSFTDAQKEQIKALVESGDTMGAQKVILKELQTEFGGSAEAFGTTLPGALEKSGAALENFGDAILGKAMPTIKGLAKLTADTFNGLSDSVNAAGIGGTLNKIFGPEAKAAIIGIAGAVTVALIPAMTAAAASFAGTVVAAAPFIATAAAIAAAAYIVIKNWEPISAFFAGLWNGITEGIRTLYDNFKSVFGGISGVVSTVVDFIRDKFGWMANLLPKGMKDAMAGVNTALGGLPGVVTRTVSGAASMATSAMSGLKTGMVGQVIDGVQASQAAMSALPAALSGPAAKAAETIAQALGDIPKKMASIASQSKVFGESFDLSAEKASALKSAITTLIDAGMNPQDAKLKALIGSWRQYQGAVDSAAKAQVISDAFTAKMNEIPAVLGKMTTDLNNAAASARVWGDATGDAEGQQQIIKSAVNALIPKLGENHAIVRDLKQQYEDLGKASAATKTGFAAIKTSASDVLNSVSALKEGFATIAEAFGVELSAPMMKAVTSLGAVGSSVLQVATAIPVLIPQLVALGGALWAALGPIGVIVAGLAVLAAGVYLVWKAFQDDTVPKALDGLKKSLADVDAQASVLGDTFDKDGATLKSYEDTLIGLAKAGKQNTNEFKLLKEVYDGLKTKIKTSEAAAKAFADSLARMGAMGNALEFGGFTDRLKVGLDAAMKELEEARRNAAELQRDFALQDLQDQANQRVDNLTEKIKGLNKQIAIGGSLMSGMGSALQGAIKNFLMGTGNLTRGLKEGIKEAIISAITEAALQGAIVKGAFGNLLESLTTGLASGTDVSGIIAQIGQQIPQVAQQLATALAPLRGAIKGFGKAPAMAAGGIVTSPTMALVGEGASDEAVLPLNDSTFVRMGAAIASAMPQRTVQAQQGNQTINITINAGASVLDDAGMQRFARLVGIQINTLRAQAT